MLTPGPIDSSMDLTNVSLYKTPAEFPQQEKSNLLSTPIIQRQSDAEKSLSPEKTKSPNESAFLLLWVSNGKNGEKHLLQKR